MAQKLYDNPLFNGLRERKTKAENWFKDLFRKAFKGTPETNLEPSDTEDDYHTKGIARRRLLQLGGEAVKAGVFLGVGGLSGFSLAQPDSNVKAVATEISQEKGKKRLNSPEMDSQTVVLTSEAREKLRAAGVGEYADFYEKAGQVLYTFGYTIFPEITNVLDTIVAIDDSRTLPKQDYLDFQNKLDLLKNDWVTKRDPERILIDAQAKLDTIDFAAIPGIRDPNATKAFFQKLCNNYPIYILSGDINIRIEEAIAEGNTAYLAYTDGETVTISDYPTEEGAQRLYEQTIQHELNHHIDYGRFTPTDMINLKKYIPQSDVINYMSSYTDAVLSIARLWGGSTLQEAVSYDFVQVVNFGDAPRQDLWNESDIVTELFNEKWMKSLGISKDTLTKYIASLPESYRLQENTHRLKKQIISWLYVRELIETASDPLQSDRHQKLLNDPDLSAFRNGATHVLNDHHVIVYDIIGTIAHKLVDPASDGETLYRDVTYKFDDIELLKFDSIRSRLLSATGLPPQIRPKERIVAETQHTQMSLIVESTLLNTRKVRDVLVDKGLRTIISKPYDDRGSYADLYELYPDANTDNGILMYFSFRDRQLGPNNEFIINPLDAVIQLSKEIKPEDILNVYFEKNATGQLMIKIQIKDRPEIQISLGSNMENSVTNGNFISLSPDVTVKNIDPEITTIRFDTPQVAHCRNIVTRNGAYSGRVVYIYGNDQRLRVFPIPDTIDAASINSLTLLGASGNPAIALYSYHDNRYTLQENDFYKIPRSSVSLSIDERGIIFSGKYVLTLDDTDPTEFQQMLESQNYNVGFDIIPVLEKNGQETRIDYKLKIYSRLPDQEYVITSVSIL